jgi:heme exporter protein A
MDQLELHELAAQRGGRALFAPVSLRLQRGAFLALHGPNGAGKTSLLRTLAGLLAPACGALSATVAGRRVPGEELGLHSLYIGHAEALKGARTPREEVRYWAAALGGEAAAVEPALARVGLPAEAAQRPCRTLSAGQRRRTALARLLACPRPLWLLDEPTASLDQEGKTLLAALIADHRAAGGLVAAALHEPLGAEPSNVLHLTPC